MNIPVQAAPTPIHENRTYVFNPCDIDLERPAGSAVPGQIVKVVAIPGQPAPGTFNNYQVVSLSGHYLGIVMGDSLYKVPKNYKVDRDGFPLTGPFHTELMS